MTQDYCHLCGHYTELDRHAKRCRECMEKDGYGFNPDRHPTKP